MNRDAEAQREETRREADAAAGGDARPREAGEAWHRYEVDEVAEQFGTSEQGLGEEEASRRLEEYGRNRIGRRRRVSVWQVVLHQFQSPLIYVLFGALVVTLVTAAITGDQRSADAIVIGLVLIVNGTVGFIQEYRAEHAVEALMQMVAPKAKVRRDGSEKQVEAEKLVPGDVVLMREGDVVPADARLMQVEALQVDESALTGESVPVGKRDGALADADEDLPPADQENMGFMGTAVTSGSGAGIVVATGKQTEIGKIAQQVEEAGGTETPLQRRIQRLAVLITWGILSIAVVAMVIGLLMGRDWSRMVTLAVALAVAAIPAGLPIVVTVALAIGVRRMAKRHAVIRHLPAVDTLGSCTTIVSDKTGTLTQNRMTVQAVQTAGARHEMTGPSRSGEGGVEKDGEPAELGEHRAAYLTLLTGVLCSDTALPGDAGEGAGDPMELALLYAGLKAGLDERELGERFGLIDKVPFKTENRFMATIRELPSEAGGEGGDEPGTASKMFGGEGPVVFVKGAPETILEMCDRQQSEEGGTAALDRDAIMRQSEALADEGLRVLAMAVGQGEEAAQSVRDESPGGLTFVGMQGLVDPPRDSARDAVDDAHQAGIRVIMVTGDHGRTASAIAKHVHVDRPPEYRGQAHGDGEEGKGGEEGQQLDEALSGRDISDYPDEQLDEALSSTNVFARVQPRQKTRIVDRLKAQNEIVAVTGDGVNDAPALKGAHLGAAMGSGTDVAKEASDMVITDDNFASVYAAVEQGRAAFRNIRMATFFLLSTGAADVLIILTALGLDWPLPLLPAQILWCNVVTNGIADVALAFEPGEKALYRRPPRPPSEGVLDATLLERLVIVGVWLAIGVLGMFLWAWGFDWQTWTGDEQKVTLARTTALTTLVLFQKVHVFNCRSEDVSIFRKSLLANKLLLIGVMTSLGIHIAAIYVPLTQDLLSLAPLDLKTWGLATGVALTAILVNELHKWLRPRKVRG